MNTSLTKYMNQKNVTTAVAGIVLFASIIAPAQFAMAAAVFNNNAADFATLRVANYTVNPNSTSNWTSSVTANPGDVVSFDIYYHNNSAETAQNVRVTITPPSGNATSQTFTATVTANNAPTVIGTATVNLTSPQTLSQIAGGVIWRPNQTIFGSQPLLSGQTGNEVYTGAGLSIGDIDPGFGTQGSVIVRMQVGGTSGGGVNGAPTVTTNSVSSISSNSVVLNGSVNPNNSNTTAWFEYGQTQSLGTTVNLQTIGSGNFTTNTSFTLNGLQQNITYYYRAVAQNASGTTYGTILSFNTSNQGGGFGVPFVTTNQPTSVSQSNAVLSGAVNSNGNFTNVWFEYGPTQALGTVVGQQSFGSGVFNNNFTYTLVNLQSNVTYYYRAVASNSSGTSYGSIVSFNSSYNNNQCYNYQYPYQCNNNYNNNNYGYGTTFVYTAQATSINPTNSTLNGVVNANGVNTSVWFEYGLTQNLGNTVGQQTIGSGNVNNNFSFVLSGLQPSTLYYYRAVAFNSVGVSYGTLISFTTGSFSGNQYNYNNYPYQTTTGAPVVTTDLSTSIGQSTAIVNGFVNPNSSPATAWFEWGPTSSFGNTTPTQTIGSNNSSNPISATLTGLQPLATYYYRAVAQNSYGTNYGNTNYVTTRSPQITTYVGSSGGGQGTKTAQTQSIVLISNLNQASPEAGDAVDYVIVYKNTSASVLKGAVMTVSLPLEVSYTSANIQPSTQSGNLLSFNLGDIPGSGQGIIEVTGTISSSVKDNAPVLFNASLQYTDSAGSIQSISSPLNVIIKGGSLFTASLADSLKSFFDNWLVDLLLLLIIAFIIYWFVIRERMHYQVTP